MSSQALRQHAQVLHGLHHALWMYTLASSLVLLWDSSMGKWVGLSFLGLLFGLFYFSVGLPCPTLTRQFHFILLNCVIFGCCLLEVCSFSNIKEVDPDGRGCGKELGGVEGGKLYSDYTILVKTLCLITGWGLRNLFAQQLEGLERWLMG